MKLNRLYVLLIFSILASCQSKTSDEAIAKELCACMEPMVAVYQKTDAFTEENISLQEMEETIREVEKKAAESEACADRLSEKYGDLSERDEAIEAAMQRVCPNIVQKINEMERE